MFKLFKKPKIITKVWYTPSGTIDQLNETFLKQTHLLIAGTTGSGKSVIINNIICAALYKSPNKAKFVLIDPKRTELSQYKYLPHCLEYASEPIQMISALDNVLEGIEQRFRVMQREGKKKSSSASVYVVIDELADLMTTNKRQVLPRLQRIAQIGRAANVHLICATQCPIVKVIPTELKVNFDSCIGLRTRSAQDSRNIIGVKGCETLPKYGKAYFLTSDGLDLVNIDMESEEKINRIVDHWQRQYYTKEDRLYFAPTY